MNTKEFFINKVFKSVFLICAASVLTPTPAHAWSKIGHEAVALIAQDILLRADKPLYDQIMNLIGLDRDGYPLGMGAVAACADNIKGRAFRGGGIVPGRQATVMCAKSFPVHVMVHSGPWHYIDIPVTADPKSYQDVEKYCQDEWGKKGQCITSELRRNISDLRSGGSKQDRQFAIMMLIHLAGDLHQPMHCIDDGDLGGNIKKFHFEGSRVNLHSVWDNIIEPRVKEKAVYADNRERQGYRLEESMDYVKLLEKNMINKDTLSWLQDSDNLIDEAALESFGIAKNTVYPMYKKSLDDDRDEPYIDQNNNKYYQAMKPITEEQIQKAGVRLAYLLEQALGSHPEAVVNYLQTVMKANNVVSLPRPIAANSAAGRPSNAGSPGTPQNTTLSADGGQVGADREFAAALQEGERDLTSQASAIKPEKIKWTPSPKISLYKNSVEFAGILIALGLDEKTVDEDILNGIDMQSYVDRAIYRKALPVVINRAKYASLHKQNWAVVFDIDETLLDNSPFQHEMDQRYAGKFNADEWIKWVNLKAAVALPGAREFMESLHRLVRNSGGRGRVVFISDRNFTQHNATKANLIAQGLYQEGDIMLDKQSDFDTKDIRRACIENGSTGNDDRCANPPMHIIALFGDSLRDFVQTCTSNAAVPKQYTLDWGGADWPLWNDEYGQWERQYAGCH